MILLQAVPDENYFVWQLYVQMLNFRQYDLEKDAVILVGLEPGWEPSPKMREFEKWTKATIKYYPDTRLRKKYISSNRPHLIAKYLKEHPTNCFFYHDQDIIFLKHPRLNELEAGDTCYVAAEAAGYTNYRYLSGFRQSQVHTMLEIVGIDLDILKDNDPGCGGAQYVIKNTDYAFWEKVEYQCESMYSYLEEATEHGIRGHHPVDEVPDYHIQIWATDMWVVLWNLWRRKQKTECSPNINFSWPWEKWDTAKPVMHNAGIVEGQDGNEYCNYYYIVDEKGSVVKQHLEANEASAWISKNNRLAKSEFQSRERTYFFKGKLEYRLRFPFDEDHSYVSAERVQRAYVDLFKYFKPRELKYNKKVLGVFNTTNKIDAKLLQTTLGSVSRAISNTTECEVKVVTCSWEPIPNSAFKGYITPFRDLGHLNYLLQLKQLMLQEEADIVCILEHDMIYPPNYFNEVIKHWGKMGVINENYIGMNNTGYCNVRARHQPFSVMSFDKRYFEALLNTKVDECIRRIDKHDGWQVKYGWCCVEPDDKKDMVVIPFTDRWPCIHVNMNNTSRSHHFTGHADVCYEQDSHGEVDRQDWGNYKNYYPE